jgi:hypothetical protein
MRRFLTLVCLLGVAIPAGFTISGCVRNPGAKYCNGLGYGLKDTDPNSITIGPQTTGVSLAFGQTSQISSPQAKTCKGTNASVTSFSYGTTNNQLVDISPTGSICAGTWNRNSGGAIPNYTICSFPNPLPNTGGLPYGVAYITASAASITSNPVEVFVHPQVTSISLVTTPTLASAQQCVSQTQTAQLDAQACFVGANGHQQTLCAPYSVTSGFTCGLPAVPPDVVNSAAVSVATGNIAGGTYVSGGSIAGSAGQTCSLSGFNSGLTGATATVALTGANTIASGATLAITAGGEGAILSPSTATLSNGTATCSGTATIASVLANFTVGAAGQNCNVSVFNNGSSGATATVTLTGPNTIASSTLLSITEGGVGATLPPTLATLSSGTASCSGTLPITSTLTPLPKCSDAAGTLSFNLGNGTLASINQDTNVITAELPGTTVVTASVAGGSSAAGFFSVCPPASINVTLANGSTAGTITQGVQQNLTTTITDTNGNSITGLSLDYQSTDPIDISAAQGGGISANFPGIASIYAICQPSSCNPSPINQIGLYGTGLPISSNPVTITTPGTASDLVWFGSPGQSQYFEPIELITGTLGTTVRLPYVPNSMLMDRSGNDLYFGSAHELMEYATFSNTLIKQDPNVPGVVLAVSPNNDFLLINDQSRHLFYIYPVGGGAPTTFGGMGNAAAWTPDEKTLYITDNANLNSPGYVAGQPAPEGCPATPLITGHSDTLYVYSQNTGWTTFALPPSPLPPGAQPTCNTPPNVAGNVPVGDLAINLGSYPPRQTPAITIPSVGSYLRGTPTVSHTWCPAGKVGGALQFYPQGDSVAAQSDVLAATTDGSHILGASLNGTQINLADIGVSVPAGANAQCPGVGTNKLSPLSTNGKLDGSVAINQVVASAVNQVVASPASNLAFITYSGSNQGASLPYYIPSASGVGKVGYVTLNGSANITAPIWGAFTPDDQFFFVSTAGDNLIHYISVPTLTDTQQIAPNLPACIPVSEGGTDLGCTYSGGASVAPTTAIVVKPRPTT